MEPLNLGLDHLQGLRQGRFRADGRKSNGFLRDGASRISWRESYDETLPGGWIVKKLKRLEWKEEQQLPSGWNVKGIGRLKMFDWKGRRELPSGWSVKAVRN
jgi:hypothetical protein